MQDEVNSQKTEINLQNIKMKVYIQTWFRNSSKVWNFHKKLMIFDKINIKQDLQTITL